MNGANAPFRADISTMANCLDLLRMSGLNVITILDGDKPVAYLVPVPLVNQDIQESGYDIPLLEHPEDLYE